MNVFFMYFLFFVLQTSLELFFMPVFLYCCVHVLNNNNNNKHITQLNINPLSTHF